MEYKFLQAMYQCNLLYGVSFTNEDDFCEIALNGWHEIGNKITKIYRFTVYDVSPEIPIELPCNCDRIISVTAPPEDWNRVTNKHFSGDATSHYLEQQIEQTAARKNPLRPNGHYIHYEQTDKYHIYVTEPYSEIEIIYKGIILDEDDLPMLNNKEMNASAAYTAYIKKFKQSLETNNSSIFTQSQLLQKIWYAKQIAARQPDTPLSQNDWDNIANVKSRWPGKVYGKSYKPLLQ